MTSLVRALIGSFYKIEKLHIELMMSFISALIGCFNIILNPRMPRMTSFYKRADWLIHTQHQINADKNDVIRPVRVFSIE